MPKKNAARKYIVHDIDVYWEADLVDVSPIASQNSGYRFILTVINNFSRYAWARPLRTKTGKEVTAAFEDILKRVVFLIGSKLTNARSSKIEMS